MPLLRVLHQVHDEEDHDMMVCAMPQDSGITAAQIDTYVGRFCRKSGLPGVKEDWDAGSGWHDKVPPPARPNVRALRRAVHQAVLQRDHRAALAEQ